MSHANFQKIQRGLAVLAIGLAVGCAKGRPGNTEERYAAARAMFERTVRELHLPSATARGDARAQLLAQAGAGYAQLLADYSEQKFWCAQALRSLGNVRAEQQRIDEAVKLYAAVAERYPGADWEIVQAWKSAADILWDANRLEEARGYYEKLVQRFAGKGEAPIVRNIVAVANKRLAIGDASRG